MHCLQRRKCFRQRRQRQRELAVDIAGPKIPLSGKAAFDGQYARHEFLYLVPVGEDHADDQIYMRLRGEENMTSFTIKDKNVVIQLNGSAARRRVESKKHFAIFAA